MRLIFMGSPAFSVPVLEALVAAGHEIVAVYTQPPRPAGRGKKQRPCPVHARALALTLDVRHPASLKEAEEQAAFSELRADAAVVVAYGLLLPQELLDAPAHGCLNIHASLLPRWRGAAPIHRAIMAGDRETGILNEDLAAASTEILVNLASNEYFKAVKPKALNADVITPQFKDLKNGQYKMISFFAKKARGLMARYIIDNRITDPEALKAFNGSGYYFSEAHSKGPQWVFLRDEVSA